MSPLLEIDSSLDPEKTLYRTIDFFSACQIIEDRTLMFPRADTFHDKNEGVERLLAQLEAYTAGGGCGGMGWSDATTAQREHERLKRSHFVSCWSTNPDSVAMWSLYSTDFQAVRVATKVKHLNATAEKLLEKYDVCRFDRDDLGSYVVAAMHGRIAPVQYESLAAISRKVSRKAEAHRRIELRYKRLNLELPRGVFRGKESMLREHERSISALNGTCYLKDTSFKHEEEIRVVVRIGMAPCNEKTLEMKDYSAPDHKYHLVFKNDLRSWGFAISEDVPQREFVECSSDFVESVAIDPRCSPHKAEFMRKWFQSRGIRVEQSKCFGYLPETFSVFPLR